LPTVPVPTVPGGAAPVPTTTPEADVKMPVAACATPPVPDVPCVPERPVPTVTLTAAPAAMDGPMGAALSALGVAAVGSTGIALWLYRRSRKQNRSRNIPTNPES